MTLLRQRGIDLHQLVERVAGHFGLEIGDLKSGSKISSISKARVVLCYVGVRQLGLSSVSLARELGVSPSAVSRAILRGPKFLEQEDLEAIRKVNKARTSPTTLNRGPIGCPACPVELLHLEHPEGDSTGVALGDVRGDIQIG